jgi:hypothetical protein
MLQSVSLPWLSDRKAKCVPWKGAVGEDDTEMDLPWKGPVSMRGGCTVLRIVLSGGP